MSDLRRTLRRRRIAPAEPDFDAVMRALDLVQRRYAELFVQYEKARARLAELESGETNEP